MISELSQRRFTIKYSAAIFESKMTYRSSKFANETEINIPYEDLTDFKESHTITYYPSLIAMGVFALLSLSSYLWRNDKDFDPYVWILWTVMFVVSCIAFFLTRENVWKIKLQNYTYIYLNKSIPNKNEVDTFIDVLFNERRKYLRETYFYINKNMPYEKQLSNLQWLRKAGVIEKEEFENTREELTSMFNSEKRTIGFSK